MSASGRVSPTSSQPLISDRKPDTGGTFMNVEYSSVNFQEPTQVADVGKRPIMPEPMHGNELCTFNEHGDNVSSKKTNDHANNGGLFAAAREKLVGAAGAIRKVVASPCGLPAAVLTGAAAGGIGGHLLFNKLIGGSTENTPEPTSAPNSTMVPMANPTEESKTPTHVLLVFGGMCLGAALGAVMHICAMGSKLSVEERKFIEELRTQVRKDEDTQQEPRE